MYRSILVTALSVMVLHSSAQSYLHQVMVLNEGYYDYFGEQGQVIPVTLGAYDPVNGIYQTVATLEGPRFGSDVIVDNGSIYVAADDRLYRFDADDHSEQGSIIVTGIRKLDVWNDLLLITRGELGGLSSYFEVRDKYDLELVAAIGPQEGMAYSAEDVVVVGDKAYLAVNNAFEWSDLQGIVGIVDLPSMTYEGQIDLGPEGLNPEKLMVSDGQLYAFNNTDFSSSSISRISLQSANVDYTVPVSVNSSCAASTMANGHIYFLEYAQNEIARFDPISGVVVDTLFGTPSIYGLIDDPLNGLLYATTTDFVSEGALHVMDLEGQVLSTLAVGVAPGSLALDIRISTGVGSIDRPALVIRPNPAQDRIGFSIPVDIGPLNLEVIDALGQVVMQAIHSMGSEVRLDVSNLRPGVYSIRGDNGIWGRFVKH